MENFSLKSTKKEILDAYQILLQKQQAKSPGGETPQVSSGEKQAITALSKYKKPEDISQSINNTRLAIQSVLGEVETKLLGTFAEFENSQRAVQAEDEKLRDLYKIEDTANALLSLLSAHDESKRTFEEETDVLIKKRKRDEEDYRFNFELMKRKEREEYEAEKRKLEEALVARQVEMDIKEKDWQAKDAEFTSLQNQVAVFPKRLEEDQQQLRLQIEAEFQKDKNNSVILLRKEAEAEKAIHEAHVKNLEGTIESQKVQIHELTVQLQAVMKQVQEVVLKTIEGSSGMRALDAVNKIALEQAKSSASRE